MTEENRKRGKKARAAGKAFELKVRADLEKQGWIVFRNFNDVEWSEENINKAPEDRTGIFKQAKTKWMFNPVLKRMMPMGLQSGFPDFICIKLSEFDDEKYAQFVECKAGDDKHKYLDKEEKEKCRWIKDNLRIPIIVATKGEKRGEIKYKGWAE